MEWMYQARNDATIQALYRGLISWGDIPVEEPIVLEEAFVLEGVIVSTTEVLEEVIVTDSE